MNEIELTDDQIIDLIFERKIQIEQCKIKTENSFHEILAKLEERLCYGKVNRSTNSALCRSNEPRNPEFRGPFTYRTVGRGRKAVYDFV